MNQYNPYIDHITDLKHRLRIALNEVEQLTDNTQDARKALNVALNIAADSHLLDSKINNYVPSHAHDGKAYHPITRIHK